MTDHTDTRPWISQPLSRASEPAEASGPARWLVLIVREGGQLETTIATFEGERDARDFFGTAAEQWSDSYLCRVVQGPRDVHATTAVPAEAPATGIETPEAMAERVTADGRKWVALDAIRARDEQIRRAMVDEADADEDAREYGGAASLRCFARRFGTGR